MQALLPLSRKCSFSHSKSVRFCPQSPGISILVPSKGSSIYYFQCCCLNRIFLILDLSLKFMNSTSFLSSLLSSHPWAVSAAFTNTVSNVFQPISDVPQPIISAFSLCFLSQKVSCLIKVLFILWTGRFLEYHPARLPREQAGSRGDFKQKRNPLRAMTPLTAVGDYTNLWSALVWWLLGSDQIKVPHIQSVLCGVPSKDEEFYRI